MYTIRINDLLYHIEFITTSGILVMNREISYNTVMGFHPQYLNLFVF